MIYHSLIHQPYRESGKKCVFSVFALFGKDREPPQHLAKIVMQPVTVICARKVAQAPEGTAAKSPIL